MANTRRVVFTFDDRSYEYLERLQKRGGSTKGDAVREALQVRRAIAQQADQGFSELVVRNPETGAERVIILPTEDGTRD